MKVKLTLVQLDHFGGWGFLATGNPVVWRWVMRRGKRRRKIIQHKIGGWKIGRQIGGRRFWRAVDMHVIWSALGDA